MRNDLAALVGSRICHDLISPIGAIGNGVELLSLTDGDTSAEMNLITESVENASARIKFFRIAYGAASETQMVGRTEILSILAASARGGRFTYYWRAEGDQPRRDVRIAFLVMQCLESAMPLGGDIEVVTDDGAWSVSGTGKRFNVDESLWATLTDPEAEHETTAAQVQFALLPPFLAESGRSLSLEISDDRIDLRF